LVKTDSKAQTIVVARQANFGCFSGRPRKTKAAAGIHMHTIAKFGFKA